MLMARDLSTCSQLLDKIEEIGNYGPYDLVREAFCWSILVKLVSCFKYSESRSHIDPEKVFEPADLAIYRYFEAVRNKHVVHDVNSMQIIGNCPPGVIA